MERAEKEATERAIKKLALSKELVLEKLLENATRAEAVKGGSNVATRCWELIGKHLGMWAEFAGKPGEELDWEDLTSEQLRAILGPAASEADIDPSDPRILQ